jgi:hypothetical protein
VEQVAVAVDPAVGAEVLLARAPDLGREVDAGRKEVVNLAEEAAVVPAVLRYDPFRRRASRNGLLPAAGVDFINPFWPYIIY